VLRVSPQTERSVGNDRSVVLCGYALRTRSMCPDDGFSVGSTVRSRYSPSHYGLFKRRPLPTTASASVFHPIAACQVAILPVGLGDLDGYELEVDIVSIGNGVAPRPAPNPRRLPRLWLLTTYVESLTFRATRGLPAPEACG
jgi:hypothetical protein